MKHSTKELYGVLPHEFANMKYVEALQFRIHHAKLQMSKYRQALNEEGYIASERAKNFNEYLLDEICND